MGTQAFGMHQGNQGMGQARMFQVPGQQGMQGRTLERRLDFRRKNEGKGVINEGKHVQCILAQNVS